MSTMNRFGVIFALAVLVGCSRKQPTQTSAGTQTLDSAQHAQSTQVQPVAETNKQPSEPGAQDSECKYNSDGNLYSDAELAKLDPTDSDDVAHDISGPIPERMASKSAEYKQYVDCERKHFAPNFNSGSGLGLAVIHLGMSRPEFLRVFPIAFGDQFVFDHSPSDGAEYYTFRAVLPTGRLVKEYTLGWRQVVAVFDAEDRLDWVHLKEHYAYPTYKSPSHVVRFQRATYGSSWGPPDLQKDGHMQWQYKDTLLVLDAFAEKNGFAFSMTLSHPKDTPTGASGS